MELLPISGLVTRRPSKVVKGMLVEDAEEVFDFPAEMGPDQRLYLIGLMRYGTQSHACRAIGVDPREVRRWREDSTFAELEGECTAVLADTLEREAFKQAMSGNDRMLTMMLKEM